MKNKTNVVKKFMTQNGFENSIFCGNERKPKGKIVVPNKMFVSDEIEQGIGKTNDDRNKECVDSISIKPKNGTWAWLIECNENILHEGLKIRVNEVWRHESERLFKAKCEADYSDDNRVRKREINLIDSQEKEVLSTLLPIMIESFDSKKIEVQPNITHNTHEIEPNSQDRIMAVMILNFSSESWVDLAKSWIEIHPEKMDKMINIYNGLISKNRTYKNIEDKFYNFIVFMEKSLLEKGVGLTDNKKYSECSYNNAKYL